MLLLVGSASLALSPRRESDTSGESRYGVLRSTLPTVPLPFLVFVGAGMYVTLGGVAGEDWVG